MRQKPCLTSSDVLKMAAACKAEAEKQRWNVTIAIVDDAGLVRVGANVSRTRRRAGRIGLGRFVTSGDILGVAGPAIFGLLGRRRRLRLWVVEGNDAKGCRLRLPR